MMDVRSFFPWPAQEGMYKALRGEDVKTSTQTDDAEQMIDEVVNIALRAGVLNGDLQIEPYLDCIRNRRPDDQGSNAKPPPLRFRVRKRPRKTKWGTVLKFAQALCQNHSHT